MKILLGCLMAMLLTACSGNRVVNYDVGEKPDDFPVLKAVGYAVIDIQPGPSQSEKMLQAIRASRWTPTGSWRSSSTASRCAARATRT
jgi:hypothetical protein